MRHLTQCPQNVGNLIDTSFVNGESPPFQSIAFAVAGKILDVFQELSTQMLLVTDPVDFDGFTRDVAVVQATVAKILNKGVPRFLERPKAEEDKTVQQVVPYAILESDRKRYFFAKRRNDVRRKQLKGKQTILVGGHAEQRDCRSDDVSKVFEDCLRRELDEELIGIQLSDIEPIGFINDTRNKMGTRHLAYIHRVRVGGRPRIRRQAVDKEFGRESVDWKTAKEIAESVATLDPWSQLVAAELFDAKLPSDQSGETLFNQKH